MFVQVGVHNVHQLLFEILNEFVTQLYFAILKRFVSHKDMQEIELNTCTILTMAGGDFVAFFFLLPPTPCRPTARQHKKAISLVQVESFIVSHV
jgi:hypothetical protein